MIHSPKKAILVTGGAGFIGSRFTRLACSRDYFVVVLDALTYAGHRENLEDISPNQYELIVGDIRDGGLVEKLLKQYQVTAVLNFAAESHVDRSITQPLVFVETNVLGTATLLHQSLMHWETLPSDARENFRFLQISTDEVYGSLGETGKFSEKTPIAPSSPYSASKAAADQLVGAWNHTYGLPTLITRCSNNYGPHQFPEKLIPHVIHSALTDQKIPVYGDGGNVRDWIHVDDHCTGILQALECGKPGLIYCLSGDAERKNIDLVHLICRELDRLRPKLSGKSYSEQIAFVKDRLGHDRRYAIDDRFAQSSIGFARAHDFESGIVDTIRWYLDHPNWREKVLQKANGRNST